MFSIVASSGHAGTKWLATVLNERPDVTWYHHAREKVIGQQWNRLDLLSPNDEVFTPYWRWLKGELVKGDVGDANSWPPHMIPAVNEYFSIDKVIYLTRNKVQQLHSLLNTSPVLRRDPMLKVTEMKCQSLYDIMPDKPDKPYEGWSRLEKLCLMVAANDFMPYYLHGIGLDVSVYDLDDLLENSELLSELAPELDEEVLVEWQGRDINRKVEGSRAKTTLWRSWSPELRAAYRMVVGND